MEVHAPEPAKRRANASMDIRVILQQAFLGSVPKVGAMAVQEKVELASARFCPYREYKLDGSLVTRRPSKNLWPVLILASVRKEVANALNELPRVEV